MLEAGATVVNGAELRWGRQTESKNREGSALSVVTREAKQRRPWSGVRGAPRVDSEALRTGGISQAKDEGGGGLWAGEQQVQMPEVRSQVVRPERRKRGVWWGLGGSRKCGEG